MNAEQKQRAMQMLRRFSQANPRTLQADNAAVDMSALLHELSDAPEPEPALVVKVEPDYCHRGHYCEGSKPYINPLEVWKLPVGTKLYTAPPAPSMPELEEYDAGALNDFGGGNVGWWQDYIRSELGRAYEFYCGQLSAAPTPAEPPADPVRDAERFVALINEIVANAASPIVDAMMEHEDVHGAGNTTLDGFRKAIDAAIERDKLKGQS